MSMTLRLNDEDDAILTALAKAEGVSKNEAALRAIKERAARIHSNEEVRRLTRDVMDRYRPLLSRLTE